MQLEIGRDYYTVFGDSGSGRKLVYNGGHSWTASNGSQTQTTDSPATTAKVVEYVSRTSYHMGTLG
jgi:hypothetical protein